MLKIGLTGGIGSGKSSATRYFQSLGIVVLDADQIARQVVQPGQPALALIAGVFGERALNNEGALDRDWMRKQVFADPAVRQRLEAITHPLIRAQIDHDIAAALSAASDNSDHSVVSPYLIVDIPLLVEKGYQDLFDRIVVVDCTPEQQLQRIRQRDGSDDTLIKGIMAAQVSRAERLEHATHILDNSGTEMFLCQQIDQLHQELLKFSG